MKRILAAAIFFLIHINVFAASVDTASIYSNAMHKEYKCVVIKPSSYKKKNKSFPVVYLLHGYSGSYSNWITLVPSIKKYADDYQLLIVCPDGGFSSWYFDSPIDSSMKYETCIGTEVPAWIDEHYHTIKNRTARAITGLSMGAYTGHLMMYAQLLSEGRDSMGVQPQDFKQTDKALQEALAAIDAGPDLGNRKGEYLSAIEIFEKTGNTALANKYKKIVLDFCVKVEANPKAPVADLIQAGVIFNKLAEIVFPAGPIREMPNIVVKLEPDTNNASKLTESRFNQAEKYKQRAAQLADRLPDKDSNRIAQHTGLVYWYTLFGKSEKAQEHTKILEELLGTADRAKLFPPRQPCPGMCGLG